MKKKKGAFLFFLPGAWFVEGDELTFKSVNESEVVECLNHGALLLSASSQLAADWKRRLVSTSVAQVCETPSVFSWQQWLLSLGNQTASMPVAFNKLQEKQLWQRIIRLDMPELTAASVRGLTRQASAAYTLMLQYDIEVCELRHASEESEALANWISALHKQLKDAEYAGRMLQADVDVALLSRFDQLVLPQVVMLDGFHEFTPFQEQFIRQMTAAGCDVLQLEPCQSEPRITLTSCADERVECSLIASRCKGILDQNPQARIAILTSELGADYSRLESSLDAVLMPETAFSPLCSQQAVTMPGHVLADLPMIQQLLHMLGLAGLPSMNFDDFSMLLFSPWLKGFEEERLLRAELDATFRRQNRHRLSFRGMLQSSFLQTTPQLLDVIKLLYETKQGSQSAGCWVNNVHELLKATGFVSSREDDTGRSDLEIRQMNTFREVLVSLVAADAVCGKLSWAEFLAMLRSACAENRLILPARFPNVVLMSLAQVSGLKFDHVLVSGLNEESFPPAAKPNPLLPAALQQEKRIPMSSGALAFAHSEQLWQQLLQAAPEIEISYAKQSNEKEMLPSPFSAGLAEQSAAKPAILTQRLQLESFKDAPDVGLQADETVSGGTAIIKNQSACPFRAFARHRLNISRLEETSPGIEPAAKGSLIHVALEYIWKQLQTQAALSALADDEMMSLIDSAINYAWAESRMVSESRTQDVEQKRMRRVLAEWLVLEAQRPDFRVLDIEKEYLLQLPEEAARQFSVKIKVDRMDLDQAGRHILIDYKTGLKQNLSKWLDERMEEPQLPLYSLAAKLGANDAVAFARVRSGEMGFEGLCGEDIGIRGIVACDGKYKAPEDWQQVLEDWKVHINALATEFVDGRCDVSPRDARACDYCGLDAVCRIHETGCYIEAEEE